MAMKPKKIISSRGESGVGAGPGRGSSGGGGLTGSKKTNPKPNMNKPCKVCGMVHADPKYKHDPKMEKFKGDLNAFLNFHSK
jgi:hypothetical protein